MLEMFYPLEEEQRIFAAQKIVRSGEACDRNLCQYGYVSCVRCCLPHIGGDSPFADSEETPRKYLHEYLGPHCIVMRFRNFSPLKGPGIEASQYEDAFRDVGKEEMERRFTERRRLFLETYDGVKPRQSLPRYMEAAQKKELYRFKPAAHSGPVSSFLGGAVPMKNPQAGELPECQLLGFTDAKGKVGCLAHPLAETSHGYDGRDQVGFFHHTGCCRSIGCEASIEFKYLSASAIRVFDKAIEGMTWYEYSRHATSVLVHYLRSYDCIIKKLDDRGILDVLSLRRLVGFTNALYDEWPLRNASRGAHPSPENAAGSVNPMDMLSADMPLVDKIMHIALGTRFRRDGFAAQVQQAREHVDRCIGVFILGVNAA